MQFRKIQRYPHDDIIIINNHCHYQMLWMYKSPLYDLVYDDIII